MLETLRKHDPNNAQRILSSVTLELLPNPEVGGQTHEVEITPDLHSEIWKEIRRRTKVDPKDASPETRTKVFEFLFSEMSQAALSKSAVRSVKARLSRRGELRSDLYDVTFSPSFGTSEAHGVRRSHIEEAIRNPDDIEHLEMLDGEVLMSLFLRIHDNRSARDRFALLVSAQRFDSELAVGVGLRVYQSDVDFSSAQRPSDILRMLVDKYGFVITVGHITSKLILNETTTLDGPIDPSSIVKIHAVEGANVYSDILIRKRKLHNSFGVIIAFALDQERYASDLRKHGVRVEDGNYRHPHMFIIPPR